MNSSRIQRLATLCTEAISVGPTALGAMATSDGRLWPIAVDGPAAADVGGPPIEHEPIITLPVKLATLAAAQLGAVASLLSGSDVPKVGIAPVARSLVEACSTVAWMLDDSVDAVTRRSRAWLLWAIAEGEAAHTASRDGGRTGAMSGSPARLMDIDASIVERFGARLDRSGRPKDWVLRGEKLPGRAALVTEAAQRWFPGADGRTFYGQVSRRAHSDVLVSLALVNNRLSISASDDSGLVATVLASWGMTWAQVVSYLGLDLEPFDLWLGRVLREIARTNSAGS